MVEQTINDRFGDDYIADYLALFAKGAVGRVPLVATRVELEEVGDILLKW